MDIVNINIKEILLKYYESNKISIMVDIVIFILYFTLLGIYYFKSNKFDK